MWVWGFFSVVLASLGLKIIQQLCPTPLLRPARCAAHHHTLRGLQQTCGKAESPKHTRGKPTNQPTTNTKSTKTNKKPPKHHKPNPNRDTAHTTYLTALSSMFPLLHPCYNLLLVKPQDTNWKRKSFVLVTGGLFDPSQNRHLTVKPKEVVSAQERNRFFASNNPEKSHWQLSLP